MCSKIGILQMFSTGVSEMEAFSKLQWIVDITSCANYSEVQSRRKPLLKKICQMNTVLELPIEAKSGTIK